MSQNGNWQWFPSQKSAKLRITPLILKHLWPRSCAIWITSSKHQSLLGGASHLVNGIYSTLMGLYGLYIYIYYIYIYMIWVINYLLSGMHIQACWDNLIWHPPLRFQFYADMFGILASWNRWKFPEMVIQCHWCFFIPTRINMLKYSWQISCCWTFLLAFLKANL